MKRIALCLIVCLLSTTLAFGGDKPSFSGGSRSSSPSFSGGSRSSSPSFSGGSKPSPSFSGGSKPKSDGPSFSGGSKSPSRTVDSDSNSRKPTKSNFNSDLSNAARHEESKIAYQKSYKAPNGKDVEINDNHSSTKVVRNLPPERVQNHTIIVEKHYHDYYGPRYDYYRSQPTIYVGGGYSSLFWYAMLDWDMNRRAAWLYNHQNEIDSQLYQQQMQNVELRAQVAQLQRNGNPDPNYVDKDFRDNPQAQYDAEFVKNASIVQGEGVSGWTVLGWVLAISVILALCGAGVYFLFFCGNWQSKRLV